MTKPWARVGITVSLVAALCAGGGMSPAQARPHECRWTAPVQAVTDASAALPTVASGRPGSPVIAFYGVGDVTEVLASTRSGTTSLGEASIQPTSGMRPQPIAAAQNEHGQAVVVYMQVVGSEGRVFAVRRNARGEWQPRQQLTASGEFGLYPQVDIDSHGRATAVWTQNGEGRKTYIVGRSISERGVLGPPFTLGNGSAEFPVVAVRGEKVAVAWDEVGVKRNPVWASTSRDGGRTWAEATLLSDEDASTGGTAIAMTGSGRVGVVWDEDSKPFTGVVRVVATSSGRGGSWASPTTVADGGLQNTNGGITTGDSETFTVAWVSGPGNGQDGENHVQVVSGRSFDRLGATATLDSTDETQVTTRVHIAQGRTGVLAAVWEKHWIPASIPDPSVEAGLMAAVREGGRWQSRTQLRGSDSDAGYPSVGVDRSGVVTAAWGIQADAFGVVESSFCGGRGDR